MTHSRVPRTFQMCHESCMCAMTHSCVPWLMCAMTHSHAWVMAHMNELWHTRVNHWGSLSLSHGVSVSYPQFRISVSESQCQVALKSLLQAVMGPRCRDINFFHVCQEPFIRAITHSYVPWQIHVCHDWFMCAMNCSYEWVMDYINESPRLFVSASRSRCRVSVSESRCRVAVKNLLQFAWGRID